RQARRRAREGQSDGEGAPRGVSRPGIMTVERQGRFRSVWVAAVGTTVVFGYTLLAVAQIFALNPAAAVPGVPLEQIRADMAAAGESMHAGLGIGIMAV